MWVTKLLISPVKIRIFCPITTKFGIFARPCRLIWCPVGWLVGSCGARAVSRKTPIYFIYISHILLLKALSPFSFATIFFFANFEQIPTIIISNSFLLTTSDMTKCAREFISLFIIMKLHPTRDMDKFTLREREFQPGLQFLWQ